MRTLIGVAFLAAQLGSVIYAQMGPRRYFCWAPNDYMTDYRLTVAVDGRMLSDKDIARRYHLDAAGLYENVAQHIIDVVTQYERTHGRARPATVVLRYRTNGREEHEWRLRPE
jgi:hypothetical protein